MKKVLLIRYKLNYLRSFFRKMYYIQLGLNIGKNTFIGKISCEWPNKIHLGDKCNIQDYVDFRISHPYDERNVITIGDSVFIGRCVEFNCQSQISVSKGCWISSNTTIVDIFHEVDFNTLIDSQPIKSMPIIIEEDVWIGTHSVILAGVVIGKGSIVGAGSIVNKSIPSGEIWAGCPAKFIRIRKKY